MSTEAAPADWPQRIIFVGSPPKEAMLFLTHSTLLWYQSKFRYLDCSEGLTLVVDLGSLSSILMGQGQQHLGSRRCLDGSYGSFSLNDMSRGR
jgi:hypothetical protein